MKRIAALIFVVLGIPAFERLNFDLEAAEGNSLKIGVNRAYLVAPIGLALSSYQAKFNNRSNENRAIKFEFEPYNVFLCANQELAIQNYDKISPSDFFQKNFSNCFQLTTQNSTIRVSITMDTFATTNASGALVFWCGCRTPEQRANAGRYTEYFLRN